MYLNFASRWSSREQIHYKSCLRRSQLRMCEVCPQMGLFGAMDSRGRLWRTFERRMQRKLPILPFISGGCDTSGSRDGASPASRRQISHQHRFPRLLDRNQPSPYRRTCSRPAVGSESRSGRAIDRLDRARPIRNGFQLDFTTERDMRLVKIAGGIIDLVGRIANERACDFAGLREEACGSLSCQSAKLRRLANTLLPEWQAAAQVPILKLFDSLHFRERPSSSLHQS